MSFGRFTVLRRIAVGGMAEVLLCRAPAPAGLEEVVIVKRMRPDLADLPRHRSLFLNEGRILVQLAHPNIVRVVDFGRVEDAWYIAMEYVPGCDLDVLLRLPGIHGNGLEPGLALHIVREVCRALAYVHERRDERGDRVTIIHSDMSPTNVLVSSTGEVKVVDFGVAQVRTRSSPRGTDFNGGKLAYAAPEQLGGKGIDHRVDIFSTGLVLWELLVGRLPYDLDADFDEIRAFHKNGYPPPSTLRSTLPKAIDQLLETALQLNPKNRYASAAQFADAIDAVRAEHYGPRTCQDLASLVGSRQREVKRVQLMCMTPPASHADDIFGPATPTLPAPVASCRDEAALEEALPEQTGPWEMMEMARAARAEARGDEALSLFQRAATLFARQGCLVQALTSGMEMLKLSPFEHVATMLDELPELAGTPAASLGETNGGPADPLPSPSSEHSNDTSATPLLAYLGDGGFAALARRATIETLEPGDLAVAAGQSDRNLKLLCDGRAVAYLTGPRGEHVHLASLGAGAFFGEDALLTRGPHQVTVQVLTPSRVVVIDAAVYDDIFGTRRLANAVLAHSYRRWRARSAVGRCPLLATLPVELRERLVAAMRVRAIARGELVIEEGAGDLGVYLIESGRADVYSDRGGERRHLAVVGPGDIVGEVAVLRGVRRTAAVRAHDDMVVFEIDGPTYGEVTLSHHETFGRVQWQIAARTRANLNRLAPARLGQPNARTKPRTNPKHARPWPAPPAPSARCPGPIPAVPVPGSRAHRLRRAAVDVRPERRPDHEE